MWGSSATGAGQHGRSTAKVICAIRFFVTRFVPPFSLIDASLASPPPGDLQERYPPTAPAP